MRCDTGAGAGAGDGGPIQPGQVSRGLEPHRHRRRPRVVRARRHTADRCDYHGGHAGSRRSLRRRDAPGPADPGRHRASRLARDRGRTPRAAAVRRRLPARRRPAAAGAAPSRLRLPPRHLPAGPVPDPADRRRTHRRRRVRRIAQIRGGMSALPAKEAP